MTELSLQIEQVDIRKIKEYEKNARTHSIEQVTEIATSITTFGFVNPILLGANNEVIAGHGRLAAAVELKLEVVPVIQLSHLTEPEQRALVLADNRIAMNSGWDEGVLASELLRLRDDEFDLGMLGFSDSELEDLVFEDDENFLTHEDEAPDLDTTLPAICKTGDVWVLGSHRLLNGDSTDVKSIAKLMGEMGGGYGCNGIY